MIEIFVGIIESITPAHQKRSIFVEGRIMSSTTVKAGDPVWSALRFGFLWHHRNLIKRNNWTGPVYNKQVRSKKPFTVVVLMFDAV